MKDKKIESYHMLPKNSTQIITFWANRSSPIHHTTVINLAMKPHQRDNYKW